MDTSGGLNMNTKAMYKLGYGLYVLTANDGGKDNGCIINTAGQISEDPALIQIAVNKKNLTHDMVLETGEFNISVLSQDAVFWVFQHYGFQSGRDVDKFADVPYDDRLANGVRYIPVYSNAVFGCEVIQSVDLGKSTLFIANVTEAKVLSNAPSATYAYYHANIKPKKNAPADSKKTVWRCKICGYEYTGGELPEDFICPLCKHPASDFEKIG